MIDSPRVQGQEEYQGLELRTQKLDLAVIGKISVINYSPS